MALLSSTQNRFSLGSFLPNTSDYSFAAIEPVRALEQGHRFTVRSPSHLTPEQTAEIQTIFNALTNTLSPLLNLFRVTVDGWNAAARIQTRASEKPPD